jgi:hypothetical protein
MCFSHNIEMGVQASDTQRREKKGGTSILHLAQYFHYPINEAAKLLDICPTVLKKICRKHGLRRWPHRKVSVHSKAPYALNTLPAHSTYQQLFIFGCS